MIRTLPSNLLGAFPDTLASSGSSQALCSITVAGAVSAFHRLPNSPARGMGRHRTRGDPNKLSCAPQREDERRSDVRELSLRRREDVAGRHLQDQRGSARMPASVVPSPGDFTTRPPIITNVTCSSAFMSSSGFPVTATKSASLPDWSVPRRWSQRSNSAPTRVPA